MNLKLNEIEKGEIIGALSALAGFAVGTTINSYFIKKDLNKIEKCYEELLKSGGTEKQWNDLYERTVIVATFNSLVSEKVRKRARILLKKVKERKG